MLRIELNTDDSEALNEISIFTSLKCKNVSWLATGYLGVHTRVKWKNPRHVFNQTVNSIAYYNCYFLLEISIHRTNQIYLILTNKYQNRNYLLVILSHRYFLSSWYQLFYFHFSKCFLSADKLHRKHIA